MENLKKFKAYLLAATMGLSMVGCSEGKNSGDIDSSSVVIESTTENQLTTEGTTNVSDNTINNYLHCDRYVSLTDGLGWLESVKFDSEYHGSISNYLNSVFEINMDEEHAERFNTMFPKMIDSYEKCISAYQTGDYNKIHNSLCYLYENSLNEEDIIYLYSLKINSVVGENIINDFSNVTVNDDQSINIDGVKLKCIYPISDDFPNILNVYNNRNNSYKSDADFEAYEALRIYSVPYLLFQDMGHRVSFNTYSSSDIEQNPELKNEVFISYSNELNKILSGKLNEISDVLGYDVKSIKEASIDSQIIYIVSDNNNEIRFYNYDFDLARKYCTLSDFVSYHFNLLNTNRFEYSQDYALYISDIFNSQPVKDPTLRK